MQKHEYFEELSALARIGQLSPEEHFELILHLKACDSCRRAGDDFGVILDQLPAVDSDISGDIVDRLQTDSYRYRFVRTAQSAGVRFIPEALNPKRRSLFHIPRLAYALTPVLAAVVMVAVLIHPGALNGVRGLLRGEQAANVAPTPVTPGQVPSPTTQTPDSAVKALQAKYENAEREVGRLRIELARALKASEISTNQQKQSMQLVAELQGRLQEQEQSLASMSADLDSLRAEKDQTTLALVDDSTRIQELNEQLRVRKAAAEEDRQLSSAAKDVRAMMGARNLHIIDVFDADGRGRSRKSFGRVFYVEGKSLIFYAFDFAEKGPGNTKVSFQAWGQREASKDVARNLGVFYIDDHAQKRWVLKVDDPEKLRAIDSLFVTVERFGGADRPSGQKLLYAYLGSQANHP